MNFDYRKEQMIMKEGSNFHISTKKICEELQRVVGNLHFKVLNIEIMIYDIVQHLIEIKPRHKIQCLYHISSCTKLNSYDEQEII